jgi:uncharacterized protein (DUF2236 family)
MGPERAPAPGQLPAPRPGELDQQALTARQVIDNARIRVREAAGDDSEESYFPEGSVLRLVQGSRVVGLLYGQLGLTIGGTDPLNYIGTSEHTRDKELPFRRLAETAEMFETVFFGSREEADDVVDRVFLMHTHVKGETSKAAGPYPKASPYAAFDPDRSLWTMACMAYPAVSLYETLERPLSEDEREDFWQDYLLVGELFGLSPDNAPRTYTDFQQYMKDRLSGGELHLTEAAKSMGEEICFNTPIPRFPKASREIMNLIMRGMLPEEVREMYGIAYSPVQAAAFRATVLSIRLGGNFLPDAVMNGDNTLFFKLVAKEEARLQSLGRQAVMPENPY